MASFPVFEFDSSKDFPMLTPQQTSPLGGVLSDAIAKRLKIAETRSKNTYANLMGSQLMAKVMEHPELLASIKDPQQRLNIITSSVDAANSNNSAPEGDLGTSLGLLGRNIYDYVSGNKNKTVPQQSAQPITQSPVTTASQQSTSELPGIHQGTGADSGYNYDENGSNAVEEPPQSNASTPYSVPTPDHESESNAFQQRAARYKGLLAQADSAGKTFGANQENSIRDLSTQYLNSSQYLSSINEMNKTITNPAFQQIMNVPFASQHSLSWYKNSGTPEQQELIGNFLAEQPQLIQNYVSQFKGQANVKEINLAEGSKVSKYDMPSVMVGKQQALTYLTKLANERQALTAEIMSKEGLRQVDAFKKADKILKGDDIRNQVYKELHPPKFNNSDVTVENIQHTATQLGISVPEVIARLQKKGINIPEGAINAY